MTREKIDKIASDYLNDCESESDMLEVFAVAKKALNQKPQTEHWIPVSEKLPEERGFYIVTEKVFSLDDREHKGRYNTMVEQVEYYNGKWQRASFFEVIAWMPLPKPYKADKGDKE